MLTKWKKWMIDGEVEEERSTGIWEKQNRLIVCVCERETEKERERGCSVVGQDMPYEMAKRHTTAAIPNGLLDNLSHQLRDAEMRRAEIERAHKVIIITVHINPRIQFSPRIQEGIEGYVLVIFLYSEKRKIYYFFSLRNWCD